MCGKAIKETASMLDLLRKSSKKTRAPIARDRVPTLLHFCFCNARDLYEEADLLRRNGKYARAFFLCSVALEELMKIPLVLNALFIPIGDVRAWREFWKLFNSHGFKQAAASRYGKVFENINKGRWAKFYKNRIPVGLPLYDVKLASLYVDFYDGVVLRPNVIFGKKGYMKSLFTITKQRIEAFEELHGTIDRSIQFVEHALRSSMRVNGKDFGEALAEYLREHREAL